MHAVSPRRPPRPALLLPLLLLLAACAGRDEEPVGVEPPALPALALPEAQVGSAYAGSFAASGGTAPLRYTVGGLPPGLTYDAATGSLSGSATRAGGFLLDVKVVDARGAQDTRAYALEVRAPLQVTTTSLPAAVVGTAYRVQLAVAAGAAPVQWTLASGALPAGLSLGADGVLAGTPTGEGTQTFAVQARDAVGATGTRSLVLEVRSAFSGAQLKVANWNLEWFGDSTSGHGPSDEPLQQANVRDVMLSVNADVWALEEVVDAAAFDDLKAQLPGYDGFASNDARVTDGSTRYTVTEQKPAVLFRTDRVQLLGARLLRVQDYYDEDYAFAGRPPLRVDLRVKDPDSALTTDLTLIVVHLKAHSSSTAGEDWQRRKDAAALIQTYVQRDLGSARVLVLGDWNDDLDTSIASGYPTPFQNFLDAPADYTYVTRPFTDAHVGTTTGFKDAIDHQMASNELLPDYVAGSATIVKPATPSYSTTTSDHYPVSSRFVLPAAP
ncbi:hypothetical protein FGE12_05115 [Aggregicoccus sp. 17bor-14]|uniref:putative Ig domain-containing protein n=1 Tax=Myxococcaceae TaxID=31 RepID=UPI00129C6FD3|nr:putative Ig domain-containing protein [Simulacricoccus sp. 17bor-14]MRI87542.1 hypothetical protein [Aggregicoccus sp. 17bor-14]